jgi:hypothetical protein
MKIISLPKLEHAHSSLMRLLIPVGALSLSKKIESKEKATSRLNFNLLRLKILLYSLQEHTHDESTSSLSLSLV